MVVFEASSFTKGRTSILCVLAVLPPPPQHSTLDEHSTTQFPFDTGRFYRTKESYVLFEVKEIYVHPYENIVTKPTRGTPVEFLPLQSEYINT